MRQNSAVSTQIRVAAYCRVSTEKEDQANSFQAQQRYFRECIARRADWVLQGIYADEGLSGTDTKKRKQFNQMIRAAEAGQIDLIVTKEISRFARNTLDALEYTRALRKLGVGVLFLLDNLNTLEADGELRLTIMASMAQEESRRTSERVKFGQFRSMEKGVVFGGSLLGYDVVNGVMHVNPQGAALVRDIYWMYLHEGKGVEAIARKLRADRILSSRGNSNWSGATVLKILKNEKYCGDLIQKKTYTPDYLTHGKRYNKGEEPLVILRDHHEPIVGRDEWNAVQRELARRRRCAGSKGRGNRSPLSGKIVCGLCGSSFLLRTRKTGAGETYKIWRCGKAVSDGRGHVDENGTITGCSIGRQLRDDAAMEIVKHAVRAVEFDRLAAAESAIRIAERELMLDAAEKVPQLEQALEAEERKRLRGLELLMDGVMSEESFQALDRRISRQMEIVKNQIIERERCAEEAAEKREKLQDAVRKIIINGQADDKFYGDLLQSITVFEDGRAEVILNHDPTCYIYRRGG